MFSDEWYMYDPNYSDTTPWEEDDYWVLTMDGKVVKSFYTDLSFFTEDCEEIDDSDVVYFCPFVEGKEYPEPPSLVEFFIGE